MPLPARRESTPLTEVPVIKDPADPSGMGGWVVFTDVVDILAEKIGILFWGSLCAAGLVMWFSSLPVIIADFLLGMVAMMVIMVGWPLFAYYIRRKAHLTERRKIYESQVHGGARAANEVEVHAALRGRDPAASRREFDE